MAGAWIGLDLKTRAVVPTHYSLRCVDVSRAPAVLAFHTPCPQSLHHWFAVQSRCLRSWDLEGSVDGKDWAVLDSRKDCPDMTDSKLAGTFLCSAVAALAEVGPLCCFVLASACFV